MSRVPTTARSRMRSGSVTFVTMRSPAVWSSFPPPLCPHLSPPTLPCAVHIKISCRHLLVSGLLSHRRHGLRGNQRMAAKGEEEVVGHRNVGVIERLSPCFNDEPLGLVAGRNHVARGRSRQQFDGA